MLGYESDPMGILLPDPATMGASLLDPGLLRVGGAAHGLTQHASARATSRKEVPLAWVGLVVV